ncbi:putative secretory phospholipase A2 receptor-like, partial [Triplophysa rosa]
KTTLTVLLIIKLYGLASCRIKYYYVNQAMTWEEARSYCKTHFTSLSLFNDDIEEQRFLEYAVNRTSDAWIGLYNYVFPFKGWMWTVGLPPTQDKWDVEEPQYNCAILPKGNQKLRTHDCAKTFPFFCMTVSTFFLVQQNESWEGALEYCRVHYDDLASPSSNISMLYALKNIAPVQTQHVWIGLRFLAGGWFWLSGDDLQYKAWSSAGQPQCPAQNQRCAALDNITKTWTPRDCEEKLSFLCATN